MAQEIKIIFEDRDLLILDKPAGWVTTKENAKHQWLKTKINKKGTVDNSGRMGGVRYIEDWVGENFPNSLPRGGICHRLDKGTSGLLVVAKNRSALEFVKEQFKKRRVKKKYWAMVGGESTGEGEINMPIGRSQLNIAKFKVSEEGKEARTNFRLIKKFQFNGRKYSWLDIDLHTGRTHQIRVHLSFLRWPLVGDKTYGGEVFDLNRPFLHAHFLEMIHPGTKKVISFNSDMPEDLQSVIVKYEGVV